MSSFFVHFDGRNNVGKGGGGVEERASDDVCDDDGDVGGGGHAADPLRRHPGCLLRQLEIVEILNLMVEVTRPFSDSSEDENSRSINS